jgi:hypothetical protein
MEINKQYSENITYVITATLIIFGIILLLHFFQIDLNTVTSKKLLQVVTIEGLEKCCSCDTNSKDNKYDKNGKNDKSNNGISGENPRQDIPPEPLLLGIKDFLSSDLEKDFCKSFLGSSDQLEKQCNQLTHSNCKSSHCCVLISNGNKDVKDNKCVAGGPNGPTFQTNSDGSKINIDYYYYQNKCYGNCPPKKDSTEML